MYCRFYDVDYLYFLVDTTVNGTLKLNVSVPLHGSFSLFRLRPPPFPLPIPTPEPHTYKALDRKAVVGYC
jgi:hypothetical protein